MVAATAPHEGRLRHRLRLAHVEERSDERLRQRWQRRLDSGEEVHCRQCRLGGVTTRVDPRHWHLRADTRAPACAGCQS